MNIVQIVPRRDGCPDGVGDYARLLADALHREQGFSTYFICGTPTDVASRSVEKWPADYVEHRQETDLLSLLNRHDGAVLLQLSAYGFARRAMAFWLLAALRSWRRVNPHRRLVTVVHEIRAHGPLTGSAFWLGPVQRRIALEIAALSDAVVTPCEAYASDLGKALKGSIPIYHLPVFSTIGEGRDKQERDAIIVFGSAAARAEIYRDHIAELSRFARRVQASCIHDIGTPVDGLPASIGSVPVNSHGRLPAQDINLLLASASAGMFVYDATRLGKSTILASYSAHGVAPICLAGGEPSDGLVAGHSILMQGDLDGAPELWQERLAAVGNEARNWYSAHSLAAQASQFAALLAMRKE